MTSSSIFISCRKQISRMIKYLIATILLISISTIAKAQYYVGVKGGIGLNMQRWNSYERDILFSPLVDLYLESHDDSVNKLYASLGYHVRGSSVRSVGLFSNNVSFAPYKFHNAVLELGFKQVVTAGKKFNGYYMLGGRLEYTMTTNLQGRAAFSVYNLVDEGFVRKINYGLTVGGGFEHHMSSTRVLFLEVAVNPDVSKQYDQPNVAVITNPNPTPFNPNSTITITPQEVRNVSLEVKVGIKFLQNYYEEDYDDY